MERLNQNQHGREIINLVDDGSYDRNGRVNSLRNKLISVENFLNRNVLSFVSEGAVSRFASDKTAFRFGRMFTQTALEPLEIADLMALGEAMIQPKLPDNPDNSNIPANQDNSNTPAGYTFLGQFISHDMSFDEHASIFPLNMVDLVTLRSKREPTLELDSLYGRFPGSNNQDVFDSDLYREDKCRFKLDITDRDVTKPDALFGRENDLPRQNKMAIIGDARNDENLAIAQMHVAFLKFHNAVVDFLEQKNLVAKDELFTTAREIVIKYYQAIILHDFLPRIVDTNILNEVKNSKPDWLKDGVDAFIPVEFSAAAFRFGHSVLQDAYDWNRIFQPPNESGTFLNLFVFTGTGQLNGRDKLPGSWAIDWRRFFDFTKYDIQTVKINKSRKIDTNIAHTFRQLQEFILAFPQVPIPQQNLASRNLVRGRALSLLSGQEVVAQLTLAGKLNGKPVLTPEKITDGPHKGILEKPHFKDNTPLWYYILKEAEVIGEGNCLGTVGSYIVAETLVTLIQRSSISIFDDIWNPEFSLIPGKNPADGFEMADLIKFADSEAQPLINPLG
jgi:hypothetical protein